MANQTFAENDPRHHTAQVKQKLDDLVKHLCEDTGKISEPKAQAIFETSAEVLLGLKKAMEDYESGSEEAMQTKQS